MKLHAVHTCPLWADHRIGIEPVYEPEEVIGWVNVLDVTIEGQRVRLLATVDA